MYTHLGVPCSPCAAAEWEEGSPFHLSAAMSCDQAGLVRGWGRVYVEQEWRLMPYFS